MNLVLHVYYSDEPKDCRTFDGWLTSQSLSLSAMEKKGGEGS